MARAPGAAAAATAAARAQAPRRRRCCACWGLRGAWRACRWRVHGPAQTASTGRAGWWSPAQQPAAALAGAGTAARVQRAMEGTGGPWGHGGARGLATSCRWRMLAARGGDGGRIASGARAAAHDTPQPAAQLPATSRRAPACQSMAGACARAGLGPGACCIDFVPSWKRSALPAGRVTPWWPPACPPIEVRRGWASAATVPLGAVACGVMHWAPVARHAPDAPPRQPARGLTHPRGSCRAPPRAGCQCTSPDGRAGARQPPWAHGAEAHDPGGAAIAHASARAAPCGH